MTPDDVEDEVVARSRPPQHRFRLLEGQGEPGPVRRPDGPRIGLATLAGVWAGGVEVVGDLGGSVLVVAGDADEDEADGPVQPGPALRRQARVDGLAHEAV